MSRKAAFYTNLRRASEAVLAAVEQLLDVHELATSLEDCLGPTGRPSSIRWYQLATADPVLLRDEVNVIE